MAVPSLWHGPEVCAALCMCTEYLCPFISPDLYLYVPLQPGLFHLFRIRSMSPGVLTSGSKNIDISGSQFFIQVSGVSSATVDIGWLLVVNPADEKGLVSRLFQGIADELVRSHNPDSLYCLQLLFELCSLAHARPFTLGVTVLMYRLFLDRPLGLSLFSKALTVRVTLVLIPSTVISLEYATISIILTG